MRGRCATSLVDWFLRIMKKFGLKKILYQQYKVSCAADLADLKTRSDTGDNVGSVPVYERGGPWFDAHPCTRFFVAVMKVSCNMPKTESS